MQEDISKILLSCGRALLYDFRCRWDGHVKAITATCPDNGRVSSRRTQAPLITRRPLQRKPCLGCTVLMSPVTTTAVSDLSEFFLGKKLISLRDTKITTLAPFKASGKPLKSDKAIVNISLESFGILSTRPLLRLTGCFIQLEVMKVATPHFQLQFRFVECNGISWWMYWALIFVMMKENAHSSPLFLHFSFTLQTRTQQTLSEGQPTPGHKGQKHRGLLICREVHHLCVFSLMHVGSRSRLQHTICHVAEAIQMFLRDFGSTDAIISSCQNPSTTKPDAAASACPRSSWYPWSP